MTWAVRLPSVRDRAAARPTLALVVIVSLIGLAGGARPARSSSALSPLRTTRRSRRSACTGSDHSPDVTGGVSGLLLEAVGGLNV